MMKNVLVLFLLYVAFAISINAQSFTGKYEFYEDGGKTAGGSVIFISHHMEILPDGSVSIDADGYQTSKHLSGTTKKSGSKIEIYFQKYDEGNLFTPFEPGELLLTLEIRKIKGRKVLWTTFGAYGPSAITAKKGGGVYFKKAKN